MTLSHQPCPNCGSSDALLVNDDGSTKCFSCGEFTPSKDVETPHRETSTLQPDFLKGKAKDIPSRKLEQQICSKYKYNTSEYKGRPIEIATYRDLDNQPVFQKIRFTDNKEFMTRGQVKPLLYGMHLFKGNNKKLIITEGEIDCLSIAQVIGDYPVVSIPLGAKNAKQAIKYNLKWIEQFNEVVFCFDMDEVGQQAVKECAALLSIGKAKIMSLPLKDPNEMLKQGKIQELYKATWNGQEYRPDGIISGQELWNEIEKPIEWGLSYPWQTLTNLTYGIRTSEMIVFGAGTGMGKTEFFKEIETHLILEHKQKIGIIHLEEAPKDTALGLMSKHSSIKFHIPTAEYTQEQKRKAFDETIGTGRVSIYDSFGSCDLDTILNTIRYMVKGCDAKFIFLDHITALGDGVENSGEVNQYMRKVVSELARLTRELDFTLFTISHLRKTEGKKSHEEGGRVHLNDLYGAAAIKQWASYVFGLERNQQAKDETTRHTTTFRILKDRYTGLAAGKTFKIKYNDKTGRLIESNEKEEEEEDNDDTTSDF
jgi:twinkle protein